MEYIPEAIDKTLGILSLTEKPDHPLMWSHYAGNHSGLVLVFDELHEFFNSPRKQSDDIGGLHRIKYRSERPRFNPLIDMSRLDEEENSEYFISWIDNMFFTKSQEWELLEAPGGNIHLVALPCRCIKGVILGQRMPSEGRARIIDFMRLDKRYKDAALLQARSSGQDFKIEITPISQN